MDIDPAEYYQMKADIQTVLESESKMYAAIQATNEKIGITNDNLNKLTILFTRVEERKDADSRRIDSLHKRLDQVEESVRDNQAVTEPAKWLASWAVPSLTTGIFVLLFWVITTWNDR